MSGFPSEQEPGRIGESINCKRANSKAAELEARAALLGSLAKSQQALARILDSVADITEQSPHAARSLREQALSLTAYQESIAETVTRLGWRRRVRKRGQAGAPWLKPGLRFNRDAKEAGGGEG